MGGGQRLEIAPGEHPATRARVTLEALGWTVTQSTRPDEVLGSLHDNLAVVRWSTHGWWVRIEQHSDFRSHEQVPTWDHPWEALRVLHLLAPDSGPALGWQALPDTALPGQLQGEAAERAYCALLRHGQEPAVATATPAFRNRRLVSMQVDEPAAIHLILHLTRTPLDRARLDGRLRAALPQSIPLLLKPALLAMGAHLLDRATAAHADPYTVIDPLLRLGSDPQLMDGAYRRALADEAALREIAALHAAGSGSALLTAASAAVLRNCAVPGAEALPTIANAQGMVEAGAWLAGGGQAWLAGLAASP
ncbi:MAG: hypothetical protein H0X38_13630 [Planctomycetes bacterium]|nr:hypothetical protein [Planctomycetota bacterium]